MRDTRGSATTPPRLPTGSQTPPPLHDDRKLLIFTVVFIALILLMLLFLLLVNSPNGGNAQLELQDTVAESGDLGEEKERSSSPEIGTDPKSTDQPKPTKQKADNKPGDEKKSKKETNKANENVASDLDSEPTETEKLKPPTPDPKPEETDQSGAEPQEESFPTETEDVASDTEEPAPESAGEDRAAPVIAIGSLSGNPESSDELMVPSTIDSEVLAGKISKQMAGRENAASRLKWLEREGGNAASENAVKLAMDWIAKHQLEDGSWSFDHSIGPKPQLRRSPHPGNLRNARFGATAMSLMVFLGAGQTHKTGDYQQVVENGLRYLMQNGKQVGGGLSFMDTGFLYSHGLATIALCEAYTMSEDPLLRTPAQQAIQFVINSQHDRGGWRYQPRQAGDTSVVGWQIMALKSAMMCGFEVDPNVMWRAQGFLDSVSSQEGALYGYTNPNRRGQATTAIGLLCRMYMGWDQNHPSVRQGAVWINQWGPEVGGWTLGQNVAERQKTNFRCGMYYNYYATQFMQQLGGESWDIWNRKMRDFLIETQAKQGKAKGSWFFQHPAEHGASVGGRLYTTTLAAMTLEVYYRYLPLYR
ncbi:MAG: hypothetical protein P8M80_14675 [Pirellulaceae bacterium]|nr:hypothetical protein [Pirellulaceae bacterium]